MRFTNGLRLSMAFMATACFGCASLNQEVQTTPQFIADQAEISLIWKNATIYFLMTDRFANGDVENDAAYNRKKDGDPLRSFEGGDIKGIIEKLEAGYFRDLNVTAIWTTPVIEQIRQPFEEYGRSYAFHGYWPRDWTGVDAAYGSEADFARMVELAHEQGIRILVDVIVNHAGPPINNIDPAWPETWVRTSPPCDYETFETTATCLIVPALQDVLTESVSPVELPEFLLKKWEAEGRLEQELEELDAFFERTNYPRAPKYYLIKWNTDWVRDYGIDGFRIDTAKHVDPDVWADLKNEAQYAFLEWKTNHPDKKLDDENFYMVGEVFNFGVDGFQNTVAGTRKYDFGNQQVDFFDFGFDALINMGFATHAKQDMPELFRQYAAEMQGPFKGVGMLNYISSHDDMEPLDPERENSFENAIKLMLAPGGTQIFYGDELDRLLTDENAIGDAVLRTPMNWDAVDTPEGKASLEHWQKLAKFRKLHPSIGAGHHTELSREPYVFKRELNHKGLTERVYIGYSKQGTFQEIPADASLTNGDLLRDSYNNDTCVVKNMKVVCPSPRRLALLAE